MAKVTNIGDWKEKRNDLVWECECGCQKYYIRDINGELECTKCGKIIYVESGEEAD